MHPYLKLAIVASSGFVFFILGLFWIEFNVNILYILGGIFTWTLFLYLIVDINKWIRGYLCPVKYPTNSWYRSHYERNYDAIILGDGTINVDKLVKGNKVMNFTMPNETLLWDYKVIKHFFSILKPNGVVIIPVSCKRLIEGMNEVKDKRPYMFDFMPYVFTNSAFKQKLIRGYSFIPILSFRLKDTPYYLSHKIGRDIRPSVGYTRNTHGLERMMQEIKQFCDEREIRPVFVADRTVSDEQRELILSATGDMVTL